MDVGTVSAATPDVDLSPGDRSSGIAGNGWTGTQPCRSPGEPPDYIDMTVIYRASRPVRSRRTGIGTPLARGRLAVLVTGGRRRGESAASHAQVTRHPEVSGDTGQWWKPPPAPASTVILEPDSERGYDGAVIVEYIDALDGVGRGRGATRRGDARPVLERVPREHTSSARERADPRESVSGAGPATGRHRGPLDREPRRPHPIPSSRLPNL